MRLILGRLNGNYLQAITHSGSENTHEVLAAVAYATEGALLFEWCADNQIPLRFYGRLDDGVPVKPSLLKWFLDQRSPDLVCKLVQHHHAKVIWWRGYGIYVGSANLTQSAWGSNIEAGCFFEESEIDDEMAADILAMFEELDLRATPLTRELWEHMDQRAKQIRRPQSEQNEFMAHPGIRTWPGLLQKDRRSLRSEREERFLTEWHETLQELRSIGERVSSEELRPIWVDRDSPRGAQADQFLHAYYYQKTFDGRKALYRQKQEQNRNRREEALVEAMTWWSQLPSACNEEDVMLNERAPYLRQALTEASLHRLDLDGFREICARVHAISDYARRVRNRAVGLPDGHGAYTIPEKVEALSRRIWNDRTDRGMTVADQLHYILYGGNEHRLPERLWQGVSDPKWKIDGLGISALGELVGWALPDNFPPRNGRTSKALAALGFDPTIHVG